MRYLKKIVKLTFLFCDVTLMLLRSQSISYFNIKRSIWLKDQNGNHIEPSEQPRLQEISIAKN